MLIFHKATALWQWWAYLKTRIPATKRPLLLNLDETSLKFFYEPARGLRINAAAARKLKAPLKRHATRRQQRRALSYVSIICDDPALQARIPQILLVASAMLSPAMLEGLRGRLADNVFIWRRKSGWVNNDVFVEILTHVGRSLQDVAPDRQPILMMDAHKVHFSSPVLRCTAKFNMFTLIFPASCTHVFQMLDTDVFARFKLFFRRGLQERMAMSPNADLDTEVVLEEMNAAISTIVNSLDWSATFRKNGFSNEAFARKKLLDALQWDAYPLLPSVLPSYEAFQEIFPHRCDIPFDLLLRPTVGLPPVVRSPQLAKPAGAPDQASDAVEAWARRLRPRRKGSNLDMTPPSSPAASSSAASPCPPPLPPPLQPPPTEHTHRGRLVLTSKLPPMPGRAIKR